MQHRPSQDVPSPARHLLRLAGWLVPAHSRAGWQKRWNTGLSHWWVLVERGERAGSAFDYCRRAFADAFEQRLPLRDRARLVRSPAFVPMAIAAILLAMTAISSGFSGTRSVIRVFRAANFAGPHRPSYNRVEDAVVSHAVPLVFALLVAVVLVVLARPPLHRFGWRYWSFLALKLTAAVFIVPLLWFETSAILRSLVPRNELTIILLGLSTRIAFIVAFSRAVWWVFADQRRRCPECLHRLALPVTIGSWSSTFEPVTTELMCGNGHGLLCVPETEAGPRERWAALDASWSGLFEPARR